MTWMNHGLVLLATASLLASCGPESADDGSSASGGSSSADDGSTGQGAICPDPDYTVVDVAEFAADPASFAGQNVCVSGVFRANLGAVAVTLAPPGVADTHLPSRPTWEMSSSVSTARVRATAEKTAPSPTGSGSPFGALPSR